MSFLYSFMEQLHNFFIKIYSRLLSHGDLFRDEYTNVSYIYSLDKYIYIYISRLDTFTMYGCGLL